jgi:hypothetical protein
LHDEAQQAGPTNSMSGTVNDVDPAHPLAANQDGLQQPVLVIVRYIGMVQAGVL